MANRLLELAGGRKVGVTGFGDPRSLRLVVFCHPTPGAGGFDPDPIVTAQGGVHLLSFDRPGYGASEPLGAHEPASFEERADDIAAFINDSEQSARSIAHTRFGLIGVVGWQTGGLVAIALAARHPDLVDRVALIDTPAPPFAPPILSSLPFTLDYLGIDPTDPALNRPGLRNRLDRMLDEAAVQGSAGFDTDQSSLSDPKELKKARASTKLIYGEDHPLISSADALWFQSHLPNATTVRVQNGRSLSIATQWDRILEHVAPHPAEAEE
ncbi:pimeloyl-ACP methyl ester carboxylesterase [Cryobacterium sp. CAN_C3]|uniref:alpha/beta fold hydrolase n=1 Tax=unclassified Cryobacterium TaxID=2649013 RepID=UPI0018C9CFF9|nr:alpha/beta hydrolase [Cryobacterium sp. CAN_C3]MEC5154299.1 pimeloyl-ACP methyl ester carboxylesterase [Cryobacterium sp. CAN_C3]